MILNHVRIILMFSPATRFAALAATTLLAGSSLAACSGGSATDTGRVQVVAAFYPLQYAVERVAGEHAEVTNLTQPGKEPHDLGLSIPQVAEVSDADLVVYEKHFQTAVDHAVDGRDGADLDAATVVDLLPPAEHEDEGGEEHGDHDHEHGELDPHFWQDPLRMAALADAVAKKLGTVDPGNASAYTANAATFRADLEKLDREFATGLTGCRRDTIVVNHDAFGYLAKYGLHLEPITGLSPDAEPTAATLAGLHDLIKEEGITTVFSETLVSKKTAQALAAELGIHAAVLDPLEGLSAEAEQNGGDYLSVMRHNLAALKKANAC